MTRVRYPVAALLTINVGLLFAVQAQAAWQNGFAFGSTLQGDLYTPTTLATPPAILVAIHYCTGTSASAHGWFDSYANTNGFYIIAPSAGKQCFDSSASRSGDRAAIVTMVNYLITNKGADKNRVFSAGFSSGGCMTNTLLAIYPDVFAGGSALPGFPAGTWPAGDTTCTKCGSTPPNNTAQQWGDLARNAFSWSGTRPCVQEWAGGADEYNFNLYLPAVAAQFTNLMGISGTGTAGTGAPNGWTRTVYKDTSGNVRVETNLGPSTQKHDLTGAGLYGSVISFLGLDKSTGSCGITSTGTGGSPGTGGVPSTGGSKATGGTPSTGGTTSGAGGTKATGGAPNSSGGTPATGGTKTTGGAPNGNGGTPATGGNRATGGAPNGNGGTPSTGGTTATGGAVSNTGGTPATGGSSSANTIAATTGGATTAATTSQSETGGSGNTTVGGNEAVGGNTAVSTSSPSNSGDQGSCSCRAVGKNDSVGSLWGLGLLGIALAAWRRRERRLR